MEKLQKLMNAIIEQNVNKSETFYLNMIKIHIEEILHVSDESSCTDNYVIAFKSLLAAAFMDGITANQLFHMATIHTPIYDPEIIPSKLNFDYDQKLFEASCAAMTGILSSDYRNYDKDIITTNSISQAKSLIDALNKE